MLELILAVARYHPRVEPKPEELLTRILLQENYSWIPSSVPRESESEGGMFTLSEWLPILGDNGFLNEENFVRFTCIKSIYNYITTSSASTVSAFIKTITPLLESRLFMCQYDSETENANLGRQVWTFLSTLSTTSDDPHVSNKEGKGFKLSENYYVSLAPMFSHKSQSIRDMAARALAAAMTVYPHTSQRTLENMKTLLLNNQAVEGSGKNKPFEGSSVSTTGTGTGTNTKDQALPSTTATLASLHKAAATAKLEKKKSAPLNLAGIGNISSIGIPTNTVKKPTGVGSASTGLSLGGGFSISTKPKQSTSAVTPKSMSTTETSTSVTVTQPLPLMTSASVVAEQTLHKQLIRQTVASFFKFVGSEKVLHNPAASSSGSSSLNAQTDEIVIITQLIEFILNKGCTDVSTSVREQMVAAGRIIIDTYCVLSDIHSNAIFTIIRQILSEKHGTKNCAVQDTTAFDTRHEAGVVFLGCVGKHLNKDDSQVSEIIQSLVEALSTPSENVQKSCADCLAPLIQMIKGSEQAGVLLEQLLLKTLQGGMYIGIIKSIHSLICS